MKDKTKRKRQRKPRGADLLIDYTSIPFGLLHSSVKVVDKFTRQHPLRESFWRLVPEGTYSPLEGGELVRQYLKRIESELSKALTQNSLAYYLHLYRRLAPGPIGPNKAPRTIGLVRATLDAAVQKHCAAALCSRVGISTDIGLEGILNGVLFGDTHLRRIFSEITKQPQLVLTAFGESELSEFYELEKLAYEVWRGMAILRALAKGAPLRVTGTDECFGDDRSDELDQLFEIYDERERGGAVSDTGTVFDHPQRTESVGTVFLPAVNVDHLPWSSVEPLFGHLGLNPTFLPSAGVDFPNFLWMPFNLLDFYEAHTPFGPAFAREYGCDLESVLAVIAAISAGVFRDWQAEPRSLYRYWQRAYMGPLSREKCISHLSDNLKPGLAMVPLPVEPSSVDVERAFDVLRLHDPARARIDLGFPGPHSVFLPCGDASFFIDFAWITRRLITLFDDLVVDDQNFKGDILEKYVRAGHSVLPTSQCKAFDGTAKQVDAAFALGDALVIAECKSKRRHIGMELGSIAAVRGRQAFLEDLLSQVDQKAVWLAYRPVGRNYDLSGFGWIFPVGVTPFAEYIWSKNPNLWIRGKIPRLLTPSELRDMLADPSARDILRNHSAAIRIVR